MVHNSPPKFRFTFFPANYWQWTFLFENFGSFLKFEGQMSPPRFPDVPAPPPAIYFLQRAYGEACLLLPNFLLRTCFRPSVSPTPRKSHRHHPEFYSSSRQWGRSHRPPSHFVRRAVTLGGFNHRVTLFSFPRTQILNPGAWPHEFPPPRRPVFRAKEFPGAPLLFFLVFLDSGPVLSCCPTTPPIFFFATPFFRRSQPRY